LLKKNLAITVVILFIDVAFAPSLSADIDTVTESKEFLEISVDIYGPYGTDSHKVSLSEEDVDRIDALFDEIKNRLDNATTRGETADIFNDVVVSLDKLDLLRNLIVEEAQQLVTGRFHDKPPISILDNLYSKHLDVFDDNHNFLCLIAGETNRTIIPGVLFTANYLSSLAFASLSYLCYVNGLTFLEGIFNMLLMTFFIPASLLFRMSVIFSLPLCVGSFVTFGYRTSDPVQNHYYPSEGWVWTNGLNGIKEWNGTFVGDIWFFNSYYPPEVTKYYVGAVGFTGIKIGGGLNRDAFFLGTTLQVGFDTDYPYP